MRRLLWAAFSMLFAMGLLGYYAYLVLTEHRWWLLVGVASYGGLSYLWTKDFVKEYRAAKLAKKHAIQQAQYDSMFDKFEADMFERYEGEHEYIPQEES